MESLDLRSIMNQIKDDGAEKLKSTNRPSRKKGSVAAATAGDAAADDDLKEVPPYILACLNTLAKNLMEREDNKRQELKDELRAEFCAKLTEKDEKIAEQAATITELRKTARENYFKMDALAQYTRSENIKIHGIQYEKGEDTNKIVKDVFKHCGVDITEKDISVSHRLMSKEEMDKITPTTRDQTQRIPVIIARLNRRDLKTKLIESKKNITTNSECPANLKKAMIYEDVTPLRSRIMYQLRNRNNKQAFRFVWSKGGRIYARTPEQAALERQHQDPPHIINNPDDLKKVGFSEHEIEDIINNVRH